MTSKYINAKILNDIEQKAAASLDQAWRETVYMLVDEIRILRDCVVNIAKSSAKYKSTDHVRNHGAEEVHQDSEGVLRGVCTESDSDES